VGASHELVTFTSAGTLVANGPDSSNPTKNNTAIELDTLDTHRRSIVSSEFLVPGDIPVDQDDIRSAADGG
jgi:hypothetical protein